MDDGPIKVYHLNTITYGCLNSPFLAIRTLHEIAKDHAPNERIKDAIINQFYVDDFIWGNDTIEECQSDLSAVMTTLNKGHMPLTKISASHPQIKDGISPEKTRDAYITIEEDKEISKVLGLRMNLKTDEFFFEFTKPEKIKFTKRGLLSFVASLFDPMGWVIPVIVSLRLIFQQLWREISGWDDPVDEVTVSQFKEHIEQIHLLNNVRIPRWLKVMRDETLEILGFSDASSAGTCAVLYARKKTINGYESTIICSKAKIVPIKDKMKERETSHSIPKLELDALRMLTELYDSFKKTFGHHVFACWCDNEAVIAWVKSSTENEKKVIKRRVNAIQKVINPNQLNYVSTHDNPADLGSRGTKPKVFVSKMEFWLTGPSWMKTLDLCHEQLLATPTLATTEQLRKWSILERYSSFRNMGRLVATLRGWLKPSFRSDHTTEDMRKAEMVICRWEQDSMGQREGHLKEDRRGPSKVMDG